MPQQIPGKSLPEGPDREKQNELEVMKLLFQHAPTYSEQYEKWGEEHPILQTGLEAGADYALGVGGPRVLRRLPGIARTAGEVWERVQQSGQLEGWKGGVAPEYRNPKKRELMEKIRPVERDPQALKKVIDEEVALPTMQEWAKIIRDQGANGPYTVTAYRGGRSPVVPGRGRHYSPNPEFASRFVDPKKRGIGPSTHEEQVRMIKQIDAEELELRKPFVYRQAIGTPDWEPNDEVSDLITAFGLGSQETRTLVKLAENLYYPNPNAPQPPTEATAGVMVNERAMMKYERYITGLAKSRGYDAVIRYSPDSPWWELVKINE